LDETLPLANAVEQMIEGFTVFRAVKQETRVRRNVERRLFQAVIVQVHAGILAEKVPAKNVFVLWVNISVGVK
jgi:hypothetical protein